MDIASLIKIRKLLRQCHYTVDINHTDVGCVASFPVRLIKPILPAVEVKYTTLPDGIHSSQQIEDSTIEDMWDGPRYCRRLSVLCDIVRRCNEYEYNVGLVRFVRDNKRLENIFEILDYDMAIEDMEKEAILLYVLSETKFGSDKKDLPEILDMVSKYDIMGGFDYLNNTFSL